MSGSPSRRRFERRNNRLSDQDLESLGAESEVDSVNRSFRSRKKRGKKGRRKKSKGTQYGSSKTLREIRDGRKMIESLLSGLVPNVDLRMMDKAKVETIDLEDFEDMTYVEAKLYLDKYRRRYAREMDRYLTMKGNPYYKERMKTLTMLYERKWMK